MMTLQTMVRLTALSAITAAAFAAAGVSGAAPAGAMGAEPPPKPKIDCRKRKNKRKPECRKKRGQRKSGLSDEQRYNAGYWLAHAGQYQAALRQLRQIRNQNDPRVLTYIGFTTRKLGRVDEAMGYYRRVLAMAPNFTLARAYLGEALLQQGKVDAATGQLAEIARRCGTSCQEYVALAGQIADYEATGRFEPQGRLRTPSNG